MNIPSVFRRVLTAIRPSAPSTVGVALARNYKDATLLRASVVAYSGQSGANVQPLPNPDRILQTYAPWEGIGYYKRVRRQMGVVSGIVELRTDAVVALPHTWVPGDINDRESLDYCEGVRQCWNAIIERDIGMRKMMFAVPDGIMVGELLYDVVQVAITAKKTRSDPAVTNDGDVISVENWTAPVRIIDLPVERFTFDSDFNLRHRPLYGSTLLGDLVDPMKVVVARYGSCQPWGEAAMQNITTDAWKLDWIDRRGMEALEKAGYPMALIKIPDHWDEERTKSTVQWAPETYKNFMIVRVGDRFEVSFPDEHARPTFLGSDQVTRIKQIQDDISIGYLSIAFSNNQKGAKASDQVRNEVRFEKTSTDSAVYDEVARQIEEKIWMINRPGMASYKRCKLMTDYKPTEDVVSKANVIVQMAGIGYPISKQQVSEDFNLRPALYESDKLEVPQPAAGAAAPGNRPKMNQNISSPAQNDNQRVSSNAP